MSPDPLLWVGAALQALVALVGVPLLALVVVRRLEGRWSTLGWGALAFVAAQAVRLPLLFAFSLLVPAGPGTAVPVAVVAVVSSGLFEEGARWLVLRFAARNARRWRDGVVFGVGHGGVEALLVLGLGAVSVVLLLTQGAQLAEALPPEQAEALAAQLTTLRAAPLTPLLAIWERVPAVVFHVAASLLVLRAVRDRVPGPLIAAVVLHWAVNATAVVAVQAGLEPVLVEVLLTVIALPLVAVILRERRRDPAQEAVEP